MPLYQYSADEPKVLSDVLIWESHPVYSREKVTLGDHEEALPLGCVLAEVDGVFSPLAPGLSDVKSFAVLTAAMPASAGEASVGVLARGCVLAAGGLAWNADLSANDKQIAVDGLKVQGVVVRS